MICGRIPGFVVGNNMGKSGTVTCGKMIHNWRFWSAGNKPSKSVLVDFSCMELMIGRYLHDNQKSWDIAN